MNVIKLFTSSLKNARTGRVFVLGKLFEAGLIFAIKARSLSRGERLKFLTLSQKLERLSRYKCSSLFVLYISKEEESFIASTLGINVIKLFY